jgi:transcriptional regulator with XRE-family HTH domain
VPRAPHPFLKAIGRQLRAARSIKGWSQEHLAAEAGIDRSYMSAIERGTRNISVLKLARIAQVLGVPISKLLG